MGKNKYQKGFLQIPTIIWVVIIIVVVVGFGQYKDKNITKEEKAQNISTNQQEKERQLEEEKRQQDSDIADLKKEIEALKDRKPEVVTQTIIKEVPVQTTEENDLPSVIQSWRPRIAHLECDRDNVDSAGNLVYQDIVTGSGMAVYIQSSDKYSIWTNKHVIISSSVKLCRINFPDSESPPLISASANVNPDKDRDFAILNMPTPDERLKNILAVTPNLCARSKTISVGEKIVILGYPGVGSKTDITATEGIISGYDGDYFITSAKVEQGNSGGAAILIKDNCYLGIPSFAQVGVIESLARILDWRSLINK